ncbi:hypothetical protein HNR46_001183 [Haloferula luteola]|uniref:Uncharacterized protein n=1 Tax=Haloferula luteola TaxID=595692 RepID=A0A840VAW9_9BACT|nr:hypothetical protein [Haloferula luteola]
MGALTGPENAVSHRKLPLGTFDLARANSEAREAIPWAQGGKPGGLSL